MKILVIYTGGTIGSSLQGKWVSLDSSSRQNLIGKYVSKNDENIEFDEISPFSILSEILSGERLTQLADCVNNHLDSEYDGIIITHGTDTIQYSAAALTYLIKKREIPIVLVSSNYPLDSEKSNGNLNFEAAVAFVREKVGKGVFVSYKNSAKSTTDFHYGTRILSHPETFDDLYSLDNNPYAFYQDGNITLNSDFYPIKESNFLQKIDFREDSEILVIDSHPGDSFAYDLKKFKAVIIRPYHSSTINTSNKKLIEFSQKAKELGVPIFIVNLRSEFIYETSKLFDELCLIKLPLCSFAAIYIKLWIAISCLKPIKTFMLKPLSGEFVY